MMMIKLAALVLLQCVTNTAAAWCWNWPPWECDPVPANPEWKKCPPSACSNHCPAGFTYKEDCGYWWWDSDKTWCEPDTVPAAAVDIDSAHLRKAPVKVFEISDPAGGCPTEAKTTFDTCQHCGAASSESCWLPYSKNQDGNCFAYDKDSIGWWKAQRGTYDVVKGGDEQLINSLPKSCPVPTTQANLDLDEFIRATWYVQKQQPNDFQPVNKLFCTAATYRIEEDRKVPFFGGKVLSVYNYANEDRVNGKPVNGIEEGSDQPGLVLCGRASNQDEASKLLVAPCFLPNFAAGDYWILATGGKGDGKYDWAVVSGGPPTRKLPDGCTTNKEGINGAGLWIFSRNPVDPDGTAKAIAVLTEKGYATSELVDVPQAGCNYDSALIKKNE